MATTPIRQTTFNIGEVDVQNWKRTELADYLSAAQSLLNVEVSTTGLVKKRRGTFQAFEMTAYVDPNSQLYEFSDKDGNYYIVLSSDLEFDIFAINAGVVSFLQTVVSPYPSAVLRDLDYADDNDVIIFTHPDYPPARLYISAYNEPSPPTFAYQVLQIYPYPSYDFQNVIYSQSTIAFTNPSATTFQIVITGGGAAGFTTDWVGGQVVAPGATINSPIGYGVITAVTAGNPCTMVGNVFINFATPSNMPTSGSQYIIRQPAWSANLGWPGSVAFYQNRLWMANAGTLTNTIFGSKINAPINYDVGTASDTDAIVYTIGQSNSGSILWMNGGKQLEIYTENFEFVAPQDQSLGLTPGTLSIRQQSSYGSNTNIKPVTYINDSYYINKTGTGLINFHFEGVGLAYSSNNISAASTHLIKNPINRALMRGSSSTQDNFVYFLNDDNTVTTFQFAFEHKLAALTPCIFAGMVWNGTTLVYTPTQVLDVVSVNNQVYFLKTLATGRTILSQFVDNVKMDEYVAANMDISGNVLGLDIFDGYQVQVIYQNQDYGQYTVNNGSIIVANQGQTGAVQIGLLYESDIVPMYLFQDVQNTVSHKKISRVYIDYYNSLGVYVNDTLINFQSFSNIQNGIPLAPQTGTWVVDLVDGWHMYQTFTISQSAPFDMQIIGITYLIESQII